VSKCCFRIPEFGTQTREKNSKHSHTLPYTPIHPHTPPHTPTVTYSYIQLHTVTYRHPYPHIHIYMYTLTYQHNTLHPTTTILVLSYSDTYTLIHVYTHTPICGYMWVSICNYMSLWGCVGVCGGVWGCMGVCGSVLSFFHRFWFRIRGFGNNILTQNGFPSGPMTPTTRGLIAYTSPDVFRILPNGQH
jgi:hypothetical protein